MSKKRRLAVPITEGKMSKGGRNPPRIGTKRPPPPEGSGGKMRKAVPLKVTSLFGELFFIEAGEWKLELDLDAVKELHEQLGSMIVHAEEFLERQSAEEHEQ